MIDYARCSHDVPVVDYCALCEADKLREQPSTNSSPDDIAPHGFAPHKHGPECFDDDVHLCGMAEGDPEPAADPNDDGGARCEATMEDWISDEPELTTAERMNRADVKASLDAANARDVHELEHEAWREPMDEATREDEAHRIAVDANVATRINEGAELATEAGLAEVIASSRADALCERIDRAVSSAPDSQYVDAWAAKVFELLNRPEQPPMSAKDIACTLSPPGSNPLGDNHAADVRGVLIALERGDRYERVAGANGWEWRISWWQKLREKYGVNV